MAGRHRTGHDKPREDETGQRRTRQVQQVKTHCIIEQDGTGQAGMSQDRTGTQRTIAHFNVDVFFDC